MNQFIFAVTHEVNGRIFNENVRCTAPNKAIARQQVVMAYQGFTVAQDPMLTMPAHHYLGEIDASSATQADYDHFARLGY